MVVPSKETSDKAVMYESRVVAREYVAAYAARGARWYRGSSDDCYFPDQSGKNQQISAGRRYPWG
jgi:hypothetical protein